MAIITKKDYKEPEIPKGAAKAFAEALARQNEGNAKKVDRARKPATPAKKTK